MTTTADAVAALTTSIDNLISVNATAQASLNSAVSSAQTAQQAAANSAASITASANTATTKAAEAAASAATAAATAGAAGSGPATTLLYPALNKILASATDFVDAFVYDVRLDSDGGEWPQKCSHTSWYNEALNTATRGARREPPKVMALVLRNYATTLTIYDLTDLDASGVPRMWMVFNVSVSNALRQAALGATNAMNCVFAVNGRIYIGAGVAGGSGTGGLNIINLPADAAYYLFSSAGGRFTGLANRNASAFTWASSGTNPALIDRNVFSIHARVLPGAPLDSFGLPIPTVACATYGGVSVLHPNWTVNNITGFSAGVGKVAFINDLHLLSTEAGSPRFDSYVNPIPYANTTVSSYFARTRQAASAGADIIVLPLGASGQTINAINASDVLTYGLPVGIASVALDGAYGTNSMTAFTTTAYATGWMPGDIKGAYLCDGTTGDITGSAELITNGTFDTDLTGWTKTTAGTATAVQSGGTCVLTGDGTNDVIIDQSFTTVVGQTYLLSFTCVTNTPDAFYVGTSQGENTLISQVGVSSAPIAQFTATGSTTWLRIRRRSATPCVIDNVSCKLASPDRSYKGKGLIVNGTLSRTAVNGGDVVAWSGFSASNYLSQVYNPDLDFGTGDFFVSCWVYLTGSGIIVRRASTWIGGDWDLSIASNGPVLGAYGLTAVSAQNTITNFTWTHVVALRRNTVGELWVNGVKVASGAFGGSLIDASAALFVGCNQNYTNALQGSISMLRISAYAPSPQQILKMYRDEVQLFDSGARAFLGGSSNAVADLDYDRSRKVLEVATGNGVSEFNGLRRVGYLDTTVTGTLTSNTMKAVASGAGYRLLASGAEIVAYREAQNGIDVMNRYGPRQVGAPVVVKGVTTDATPTNLAPRLFVSERERINLLVRVIGYQYGGAATERFSQTLHGHVYRDDAGNVTLGTSAALQKLTAWNGGTPAESVTETTSTLDAAFVVDTATQTIAVQVIGKAATRIVWTAEILATDVGAQPYN